MRIPTNIIVGPNASAPEQHAAAELAQMLGAIAGTAFSVLSSSTVELAAAPQIAVGLAAVTRLGLAPAKLAGLGREGFVCSTLLADGVPAGSLALSGGAGAPRGTLYAVNYFLEELGVQFLAQDTTIKPASLPAALPVLNRTFIPTMEYRLQFEYPLMQTTNASLDLNVHLGLTINDNHPERGAAAIYAPPSFVHTSCVFATPTAPCHCLTQIID